MERPVPAPTAGKPRLFVPVCRSRASLPVCRPASVAHTTRVPLRKNGELCARGGPHGAPSVMQSAGETAFERSSASQGLASTFVPSPRAVHGSCSSSAAARPDAASEKSWPGVHTQSDEASASRCLSSAPLGRAAPADASGRAKARDYQNRRAPPPPVYPAAPKLRRRAAVHSGDWGRCACVVARGGAHSRTYLEAPPAAPRSAATSTAIHQLHRLLSIWF